MSENSDIKNKYKKMSQIEHVLKKPGMYIGEVTPKTELEWIFDKTENKMIKQEITYSPGLYKIFDEILVNALDETTRDKTVNEIKIDINENTISVYNNGKGIDVAMHPEHKIWVPELIFANLLTSTNYGDNQERTTGGTHGLGAKLTAIFSKEMIIEIGDKKNKKEYYQVYKNNLSEISKPIIKKYNGPGYVKITFTPDFEKFGFKNLDKNNKSIMVKRIYDIAALSPDYLNVYYNNKMIDIKNFEEYAKLYIGQANYIYQKCGVKENGWEIILADSENETFNQISFVNGIYTNKGGKHVDFILDQVINGTSKLIKNKGLKDSYIKDNVWLFIKSTIINPSFSSQTKEELNTKPSEKDNCILPTSFYKKIKEGEINLIENVLAYLKSKEMLKFSKSDGKKKSRIKNIPKLDDANYAGTKKGVECTLILTEGDSAKAMAISGIAAIKNGRNNYGVFPLKGKLLNVRDASHKQLADNQEINNLKKILGLQMGSKYTAENLESLRYGSIMLMMDADVDGSHIKGLFINMLENFWPSLLKIKGFLKVLVTPVVKASYKSEVKSFKNLTLYDKWKEDIGQKEFSKWYIKYYKGLGTSTSKEAKEYFSNLGDYLLTMQDEQKDKTTNSCILLAFSKKMANQRKEWLAKYDKDDVIDFKIGLNISICDFVNKELIHFSNYDNIRSIPSLLDGFKPSQRKVLFGCFKRNLISQLKVAQLAGYISEHTAYHHGENSLVNTIINMAQNFLGSNNMNLLEPIGQFGTRIRGGKDHSSARYIFTNLSKLATIVFNKDDNPILNYLNDDGTDIEPGYYLPILPMILVNGSEGIGTGYSTSVPKFNPSDLKNIIITKLKGEKPNYNIQPWYNGFKGKMIKIDAQNYISQGRYAFDKKYLIIDELPIGLWSQDYKEFLDDLIYKSKDKIFSSYQDNSTDTEIKIILKVNDPGKLTTLEGKIDSLGLSDLTKLLKLNKTVKMTNMYLYDKDNKIKKYKSAKEIIDEYYLVRLEYYQKRKDFMIEKLTRELKIIESQVKFISGLINKKININNLPKDKIIEILKKEKMYLIKDEPEYDYLIKMPIYSFSKEKVNELDNKFKGKKTELGELRNTDINNLWIKDLDKLIKN
ncbi:DNA gyrase/topoisomerase IV, subunit A [seawater metagenome]|uniref:DNA topoisomerase (ATP-hydrolyzing) n=1 Tax=seawater metagenome TaxID=1561972 RepID=A0A5E8CLT2_9ZZZZ